MINVVTLNMFAGVLSKQSTSDWRASADDLVKYVDVLSHKADVDRSLGGPR